MSLIFIPITDYNRDANSAETISDIDLGSIRIGESKSFSFRIGNTGTDSVSWSLSVDNSDWELPDGGILNAGQTTDTLTVRVNLPIDAVEMGHVVDLVATDGTDNTILQIAYEAMGTNSQRRSNYPRRAGQSTDAASNVIDSLGDILKVLIFDPIPLVENSTGYGQKTKAEPLGQPQEILAGYQPIRILDGSDPCDRLNPNDEVFGYTKSVAIVQGQFSRESRETRTNNLTATDTTMEYQVGATLALPGEFKLDRMWALFEPANEIEPAQYKRSVFIIPRQGELWSIENIRTMDKGDELSHFEADLVALHPRNMGKPTFWNPFAITYQNESDVPYSMFTCQTQILVDDIFEGIPSGLEVYSGS